MGSIGNVLVKISADISGLQKGLAKAESRMQRSARKLSSIGSTLSTTLTLPIAAAGFASIKAAADFEKLETQLSVLLGSAEKGSKMFKDLTNFASSTPFQIADLAKTSNQLLAFGFTQDEVMGSLQNLGDIAASTGSNMSDLALILGQSKAIGAAYTQDLRQLANRGIPVFDLLKEKLNVTGEELSKMVSDGKISFEILQSVLQDTTKEGGVFAGGMEAQSKTLSGMFSTLKDNVTIAFAEIGRSIASTTDLQAKMKGLTDRVVNAVKWFIALPEPVKKSALAVVALVAAIGPLLKVFASFKMLGGSIISVLGFMLSPVGLVIAAIAALVVIFVTLYKKSEKFRNAMDSIAGAIKRVGQRAGDALIRLNPFLDAATKAERLDEKMQKRGVGGGAVGAGAVGIAPAIKEAEEDAVITPTINFDIPDIEDAAAEAGELAAKNFDDAFVDNFGKDLFAGVDPFLEAKEGFIEFKEVLLEGLGQLKEPFEEFKNGLDGMAEKVDKLGEKTEDTVELSDNMKTAVTSIMGVMQTTLESGAKSFGDYARAALAAIAQVIKGLIAKSAIDAIAWAVAKFGPVGGLVTAAGAGGLMALMTGIANKAQAPRLARGGLTSGPTMAMIGDNPSGREAVIPFERMGEFLKMAGIGGGGNMSGELRLEYNTLDLLLDLRDERKNRIG